MATWDQLKQALTANGINFEEFGEDDTIVAKFDTEESGKRSQVVFLKLIPLQDLEYVRIESPIAPSADTKRVLEALRAAYASPYGIASDGEFLAVRTAMPLADLDYSELEFFMKTIYTVADILEEQVFQTDDF